MQLLLVEPNSNLARIMGELFVADGFTVLASRDVSGGTSAVNSTRVEAAIISYDLPGGSGMDIVRALRRREGDDYQALVILIADAVNDDLRYRARSLGVNHVLRRPVSLLDIAEIVRAAPPLPTPKVPPPFHAVNAAELARCWMQHVTGVMQIEHPTASALVLLHNGGPVGTDGRHAMRAALRGGHIHVDPCPVDGPGDRDGLGELLWTETREWAAATHVPVTEDRMVIPTSHTTEAIHFPVRPSLRGTLRGLTAPRRRSEIAAAMEEHLDSVSVDLEALAALGLITLAAVPAAAPEPARRRPTAPRPAIVFNQGGDLRTDTKSPSVEDVRDEPSEEIDATDPAIRRSAAPEAPVDSERAPVPPITTAPTPLPPPRDPPTTPPAADPAPSAPPPDPDAASTAPTRAARRGPIRSIPPIMERTLRRASQPDVVRSGPSARGGQDVEAAQQLLRLRREADVVRGADPWTVLGVPRNADAALVEQVGARMEARYSAMSDAKDPEVAYLATQITNRIKEAMEATRRRSEPVGSPEQALLQAGKRAVTAESWGDADTYFGKARELTPDSPEALAGLGWARFNNRDVDRAERESDAVAYLELAIQFNPTYTPALMHLAEVCQKLGKLEEARTHLKRVLRQAPNHPEATTMLRRLGG